MTRLIAIVAAVVLLVGVPGAYAATHAASTHVTHASSRHSHHRRLSRPVARARHDALRAYFGAKRMARLVGSHLGAPRLIRRVHGVHWLHALQRHWVRVGHWYQRVWHRVLLARHATRIALSQVGTPYVYGAASPHVGFDCSGLVMWAFGRVGVHLPHSSYAQASLGVGVPRSQMRRGDLVFEYGDGHVGIYLGHGLVLAAPHSGMVVSRQPIGQWQISAVRRVA